MIALVVGRKVSCASHETEGVYLADSERTPERFAELFNKVSGETGQPDFRDGAGQFMKSVGKAANATGVKLG